MNSHYHYIIAGAGLAGSSLLMQMLSNPFFQDKKILVVDASEKNQNDRTWCFWEKQPGLFESIVKHQWKDLSFYANDFQTHLNLGDYSYKMIESQDLYRMVRESANSSQQVTWLQEPILKIFNEGNLVIVKTALSTFSADYVFNSILFEPISISKNQYYLQQHFKGWVIETPTPTFDPGVATFMDFRISQEPGTSFVYILPTSPNRALIEYTLFTKNLLADSEYDTALKKYISEFLKISDYQIAHIEYGIIPMTNYCFRKSLGRVIHIGIAGGAAKGSSGYAFQFVQKRTQSIIADLVQGQAPKAANTFSENKFRFYDSVLLNVIANRKMPGAAVFKKIFQKNKGSLVLSFLDNETNLWQDLQIMRSVPMSIFLPAALEELRLEI